MKKEEGVWYFFLKLCNILIYKFTEAQAIFDGEDLMFQNNKTAQRNKNVS